MFFHLAAVNSAPRFAYDLFNSTQHVESSSKRHNGEAGSSTETNGDQLARTTGDHTGQLSQHMAFKFIYLKCSWSVKTGKTVGFCFFSYARMLSNVPQPLGKQCILLPVSCLDKLRVLCQEGHTYGKSNMWIINQISTPDQLRPRWATGGSWRKIHFVPPWQEYCYKMLTKTVLFRKHYR